MPDKFIRHGAAVDGDGTSSALAQSGTVTFDTGTDVVTWTGHPLNDGDSVYFTTTGALPTGLTANTRYFVRDKTTDTFKVAATAGGAAIDLTGSPSGTHTGITSGAWNSITIVEGTAPTRGSVAAGDVVYIRSRDNSGANITRSGSTYTLGSTAGTAASPVTWVLDNGAIWAGIDGVLTHEITAGNQFGNVVMRINNVFVARTNFAWRLQHLHVDPSDPISVSAQTQGLQFSHPNKTGSSSGVVLLANGGFHGLMKIVTLRCSTNIAKPLLLVYDAVPARIFGLFIEIGSAINGGAAIGYSSAGGGQISVEIYGGSISGAGATTGVAALALTTATTRGTIHAVGLTWPNTMTQVSINTASQGHVLCSAVDGGSGGLIADAFVEADSRNVSNFYPYLNASQPDSASTPISWRFRPTTGCSPAGIARLPMYKLYSSEPAVKTLTLELLIATAWAGVALSKANVWMEVSYVDHASGLVVTRSTRDYAGGALDTSTAAWSSTSWGAVGLGKRKLALTTHTSVKKDSAVVVNLCWAATPSGGSSDVAFVCPDFQFS